MPADNRPQLIHNSYGKSRIRVTKLVREGSLHTLLELSVDVTLEGDFDASYETGDNASVIATDSIKNTVYVVAKEKNFSQIEDFAIALARHFVGKYEQVTIASIAIEMANWRRIETGGKPHDHAFTNGGQDQRTCLAVMDTTGDLTVFGGVSDLLVLKTTASEFHGFVDDRYRTLADTNDRIFATTIDATWQYAKPDADYAATYETAKRTILETFTTHHSLAVQQTLLQMGRDVLAACSGVTEVEMQMPNQHRIPVNLEPFGLTNENDIFVATDEPFGMISGTVSREA